MNSMLLSFPRHINLHIKISDAWLPFSYGCPGYCTTVDSRFLKPSCFTYGFEPPDNSNQNSFPLLNRTLQFCPDLSNYPIFRTNFRFPWRFEESGFHCISAYYFLFLFPISSFNVEALFFIYILQY